MRVRRQILRRDDPSQEKKMARTIYVVCVLAAVLANSAAEAVPAHQINVVEATAAADLIIVGRSVWLETHGLTETHQLSNHPTAILTVKADRVLKGSVSTENLVTIKAELPESAAPIQEYGVFFLRAAGDGTFVGADPRALSAIATPTFATAAPSPDPLVAVAQELAAVLAAPASRILENRTRNESLSAIQQSQKLYNEAEGALWEIPASASEAPLEAALQSASDVLSQGWIIAALTEKGVSVSMDPIKSYLQDPIPGTDMTRAAVLRSFETAHPSPDLAPTLVEFLGSKDVEMRRAAAHGLRNIGDESSIKALAVTALQDGDAEVRYYAETGLCWATKAGTPPCDEQRADFNRDDTRYRAYWTDWAKGAYR
jgi:HEAT repeats